VKLFGGEPSSTKQLIPLRHVEDGSGAAAIFVEYTPIPDAVFPTKLEPSYAAAKWVAAHGAEIGVDGRRIAVAGNSVGGDMSAALALMAKDRGGPNIRLQVLITCASSSDPAAHCRSRQTGSMSTSRSGKHRRRQTPPSETNLLR
jgi:acetyl esterase/lipase